MAKARVGNIMTAHMPSDAGKAIEVQRLNKRFAGRLVLEQVTFDVQPGRVVGLLGPNGAGKTTLLRCLTGHLKADCGRCLIDGVDPARYPQRARLRFGYHPDQPPLEPQLRAREHLALHARLRGIPGPSVEERIAAVLKQVDLEDRANQLVGTLSRGQRSRIALAECLLHRPPVLILDEPASGLDPAQVVALRALLRELAGEHAILLATHHLAEAAAVCDQLVVLVQGRVTYQGSPAELAGSGELERAYLGLAGVGA